MGRESMNGPVPVIGIEQYNESESYRKCSLPYCSKVFFIGDLGSGKSSLIQSLISGSSKTVDHPTEGVTVDCWQPFADGKGNESLFGRKLTDREKSLILNLWDLGGRQVCQGAHFIYLTPGALYVVVFNVVDQTSRDSVSGIVSLIQAKCPGCTILLVSTKIDKVFSENQLACNQKEVLKTVQDVEQKTVEFIKEEVYKLKLMNANEKTQEQIEYFERLLSARPNLPEHVIGVSCVTAKGLDEIRKAILKKTLNDAFFPHLCKEVNALTIKLYNKVKQLKNEEAVLIHWSDFVTYCQLDGNKEKTAKIQEEMAILETCGCILCYRLQNDTADDNIVKQGIVCVNPSAFCSAVCYMLVDDDKKAFRLEAGRFWPCGTRYKKPDPGILVRALEEVPMKGVSTEVLFPLLWQESRLTDNQVTQMFKLLKDLDLLLPYISSRQTFEELAMPHFPSLSTSSRFYMPLLGLLQAGKPQLNWMPKPLKDDLQITWRWDFYGNVVPGLMRRMVARCKRLANNTTYEHLWNHGVLLKIAETWIHISFDENKFDISVRVNAEEEGNFTQAIELCWILLAKFVHPLTQLLKLYQGLVYKIYFNVFGDCFYNKGRREAEIFFPVEECFSKYSDSEVYAFKDVNGEGELDVQYLLSFQDGKQGTLSSWIQYMYEQQSRLSCRISQAPKVKNHSSLSQKPKKKGQLVKWNLNNETHARTIEIIPRNITSPPKITVEQPATKKNNNGINVTKSEDTNSTDTVSVTNIQKGSNAVHIIPVTNTATNARNARRMVKTSQEQRAAGIMATKENNNKSENNSQKLDKMSVDSKDENSNSKNNNDNSARTNGILMSEEHEIKEATRIASAFVAAILANAVAEYIEFAYEDNHGTHKITAAQVTAAKVAAEAASATQGGNINGAAYAVIHAAQGVQAAIEKQNGQGGENRPKSKLCTIL